MKPTIIPFLMALAVSACADGQDERGPRMQPGTTMGLYAPEQHAL